MASKEKVDIKRNEQFQEMDDELSKAMADLESTMDRVSALLETGGATDGEEESPSPEEDASAAGDPVAEGADLEAVEADAAEDHTGAGSDEEEAEATEE